MSLTKLMWACISMASLTTIAVAAQEYVTQLAVSEDPSMYEILADKVPGLLVLVFLVLVFFRHLDNKAKIDVEKAREYKDSVVTLVETFRETQEKSFSLLNKQTEALDRVENAVVRLTPFSPPYRQTSDTRSP